MQVTERRRTATAIEVPVMKAGSHETMLTDGFEVTYEGEHEIEYTGNGSWVLVDAASRQIVDFG